MLELGLVLSTFLIASVVPWNVPESMSNQQGMDMIQEKIELLGATKTGSWSVDCESYVSAPNLGRFTTFPFSCKMPSVH